MNDAIKKLIKRDIEIRQLTKNEIVQQYLKSISEITDSGKLAFLIEGNLQWKTTNEQGVYDNGIWLKSNYYDLIGKNFIDDPVSYHLQYSRNLFEIGGTIDLSITHNTSLENSKTEIINSLDKITLLSNSFSFLHGSSIDWYPARYIEMNVVKNLPPQQSKTKKLYFLRLRRYQNDSISVLINDEHVKNTIKFCNLIQNIQEPEVKSILKNSIDWHSDGNRYRLGLGRFVSYWTSIELLGEYLYSIRGAKKNKDEQEKQILEILSSDCKIDIINKITKCYRVINPPIKEKLSSFLDIIPNSKEVRDKLFKGNKSLYTIRNKIAHGSISEHDFEKIGIYRERLYDMYIVSRNVIIKTLENLDKLRK
jgi:hypothetical protein